MDQKWRARRERLEKRLASAMRALAKFCEEHPCPHQNAIRTARSNVGNYDPSADRYWYEYACSDCGRAWTEPQ